MKKLAAIAIAIILVIAINWGLNANGNDEHVLVNDYQQDNTSMKYDTSGPETYGSGPATHGSSTFYPDGTEVVRSYNTQGEIVSEYER